MYKFEVTTLPSRQQPTPRQVSSGTAPTDRDARIRLAESLSRGGVISRQASLVANQVTESWTDFPELGVTARLGAVS